MARLDSGGVSNSSRGDIPGSSEHGMDDNRLATIKGRIKIPLETIGELEERYNDRRNFCR